MQQGAADAPAVSLALRLLADRGLAAVAVQLVPALAADAGPLQVPPPVAVAVQHRKLDAAGAAVAAVG
jgi:hypothetical protein